MNVVFAARLEALSIDDYLAGELRSPVKHEYVGGKVYAMVGGTYAHNLIASNLLIELGSRLKGSPCRALHSDTKVLARTGGVARFYYPDALVVRGEDVRQGLFQDRPTLVAEVLSDSTRRIDEGEKLEAYLAIPTLAAYLMFEQEFPAVTVYRRRGQAFERETHTTLAAVIPLPEIGVNLPLADVYAEVPFSAAPPDNSTPSDAPDPPPPSS